MKRRSAIKGLSAATAALLLNKFSRAADLSTDERVATGMFKPSWQSLKQYQVPDWFRDAKFGMWAHWGPQCQPEHGDWYARSMYQEGSDNYNFHLKKYGHPSKFGFKDVINEWKAENWNPDELVGLYKNAGAQYFFALANHHDNLDLYKSKYQPNWNSTKVGPKKDLVGGWAKAAKNHGLRFGVSVHASHAWRWMESAQLADKNGPMAGVSYDGNLTKNDGKGKWWDGLEPQELYAQHHPLSQGSANPNAIHNQWAWQNGAIVPDKAYCDKFKNRTIELINKYEPDLIYFDDTALPLWPVSDAGLQIAAHMYNTSIKKHGKLEAVLNGKILDAEQQKCMVWDIERGQSNKIEPFVWQTDTCIGDWHYDRRIYDRKGYKSAKTIIHTLADVVSKNGNLLLNVPVRGDGTIDDQEKEVVAGITQWMQKNSESIYATRPFTIFGEGPAIESAAPLSAQGFNEGKGKPFTAQDIRFTTKGDILYAIALGTPAAGKIVIKSLSADNALYPKQISRVEMTGTGEPLHTERNENGLTVTLPENFAEQVAYALKIIPA